MDVAPEQTQPLALSRHPTNIHPRFATLPFPHKTPLYETMSVTPEHLRHGSCLEHGAAHEADHAQWSRRDFLLRLGLASAGVAFAVGGQPVSVFGHAPSARALNAENTNRTLVLIQLNGGNDGLNTVVPVNNDIYYRSRPTIAIPKSGALLLDDNTGLHPALQPVMPLWGNGHMAVVHNTGYNRQTRSHFEGTVNWSTARDQGSGESTGWLGRYLSEEHQELVLNPVDYPLAVRVGGPATLFQSQFGNLSVTFGDASQFEKFIRQGGFYSTDDVPSTFYGDSLSFVRKVTNASYRYVASVQEAANRSANLTAYPGGRFGANLAVVARLIRGNLGSRVYTVSKGGFDTHSRQGGIGGSHAGLWADVAGGVASFFEDLAQDGLDENVMVMTFSEFGRTLNENGSGGTDHGAGAPLFVFGKGLNGGIYGTQSDLRDLYGGDPRFTTDYRSVYATILQDWFGLSSNDTSQTLGGSFGNMGFVNSSIGVRRDRPEIPHGVRLEANYPNPFNPTTTLPFVLDRPSHVRLEVFDTQGRHRATLINKRLSAGEHVVSFDAQHLPSGTYVYRLTTPAGSLSRRMLLLK